MYLEPDDYLKATAPMPVVLLTTLNGDVVNAAPYAWHMPISMEPPLYGVAIRDIRDTFLNIGDTDEFVINFPGPDLLDAIRTSARSFPRDVSEMDEASLTPLESRVVRTPSIAECDCNLECRLEWAKEAGDHHVVVGRVVAVRVSDEMAGKDLSKVWIDPVLHVGGGRNLYIRQGMRID